MSAEEVRPRIKICGVTRPQDADLAAGLGADLVGLNFWPGSPRRTDLPQAREIAAAVAGRARLVGVFVDERPGRVDEIVEDVGLDLVQLHGDEPEAERTRFGARLLRVLRADELVIRGREIDAAGSRSAAPFAFLVDAPRPAGVGGTGRAWNWSTSREWIRCAPAPVLVAGGVRPGSAARALAESGAAGVDVASGVERAPGVKDAEKMRRLFEELRGVAT